MVTKKIGKSRRNRCKPRTTQTLNNKLRSLKSRYTRLFNNSVKYPSGKSPHFHENYPTFDSFKVKINLREIGRNAEPKSKITRMSTSPRVAGWYK